MSDVVVIGAGLAGLVAALRLAQGGARVTLLAKGIGGLPLSQGTIDVLGYAPDRVSDPLAALDRLPADHPYTVLGADAVRQGVEFLADSLGGALVGTPTRSVVLPTAVGALRPTCLVPPSMLAGEISGATSYAIVGFQQLKDFFAPLCAANLARQDAPGGGRIQARPVVLDLPAVDGWADSNATRYAKAFDDQAYRARFATAVAPHLRDGEVVGVPAVLGLDDPGAHVHLEQALGHPVFEIPLPPPSVPGLRLNGLLTGLLRQARVRVVTGSHVVSYEASGGRITSVVADTAGRPRAYAAKAFVHAPGGLESGAITMDSYGAVSERVFGLPLANAEGDLVSGATWTDQPLYRVGVSIDSRAHVSGPFDNLYAAGGIIAGAVRWSEKSGDGIAIASAVRAADSILRGA